jgi:hypothetical protein
MLLSDAIFSFVSHLKSGTVLWIKSLVILIVFIYVQETNQKLQKPCISEMDMSHKCLLYRKSRWYVLCEKACIVFLKLDDFATLIYNIYMILKL